VGNLFEEFHYYESHKVHFNSMSVCLLLLSGLVYQQEVSQQILLSRKPLKSARRLPDFTLADADGKSIR